MEEIVLGYTLAKPVTTQEECTAYAAMAEAVNAHNAVCAVGDTLWGIEDKADCYEVAEGGTVPEPEPASTLPTTEERIAALEAGLIELAAQEV
jgi:hypothetical protein